MDIPEAELTNPYSADDPEMLPDDSVMLIREIKKALSGDDFKYIPDGEKKQKDLPGFTQEDFNYYLNIHIFSNEFGLPHGKGWVNELPWVPGYLVHMRRIKKVIEAWMMRHTGSSGPTDPGMFTGRS